MKKKVSTSVIIPCTHSHIHFLPNLLQRLKEQSSPPSEVVISVSDVQTKDHDKLDRLVKKIYPFSLKILKSTDYLFAGDNRNIAIKNSTSDLIICQDADDVPHKQRVEIISQVYKKTSFTFLVHLYRQYAKPSQGSIKKLLKHYDTQKFSFDKEDILLLQAKSLPPIDDKLLFFSKYSLDQNPLGIQFGHPAFRRDIFPSTQYTSLPNEEDRLFFITALTRYRDVFLLNIPLVYYIIPRSTSKERNEKAFPKNSSSLH